MVVRPPTRKNMQLARLVAKASRINKSKALGAADCVKQKRTKREGSTKGSTSTVWERVWGPICHTLIHDCACMQMQEPSAHHRGKSDETQSITSLDEAARCRSSKQRPEGAVEIAGGGSREQSSSDRWRSPLPFCDEQLVLDWHIRVGAWWGLFIGARTRSRLASLTRGPASWHWHGASHVRGG